MKDIAVNGISKSFGEKKVLENFSAVFPAGKTTCIMGESGSGKTTLLRMILGLEHPDQGSIEGNTGPMSVVFQEDRLCEGFSSAVNAGMVLNDKEDKKSAEKMLEEMGMKDDIDTPVSQLSGGMKRRVAIARALVFRGEWLIMDEPFKGLDEDTRAKVIDVIKNNYDSVIMVTHSIDEAKLMNAQIVEL